MVCIADKASSRRTATAACAVVFSDPATAGLVRANALKKGDVLATARIAGIMAAKRTPDLIPLCHPIAMTHARVELEVVGGEGGGGNDDSTTTSAAGRGQVGGLGEVRITATVGCDGKTGVEMEALTAAAAAALTVYDMCKAVDRGMRVEGLRVVAKEGGRSGAWAMP
jgi:cyclic pyranopterin phosphate synthase